jgi:hypothetical protein
MDLNLNLPKTFPTCPLGVYRICCERIRVSRVCEHSCTPLLVYRLLLEAATQCFRFSAISVFFFLKKIAQVAIVGNKTEPKMTINSGKTQKKIIHNNLLRSFLKKKPAKH